MGNQIARCRLFVVIAMACKVDQQLRAGVIVKFPVVLICEIVLVCKQGFQEVPPCGVLNDFDLETVVVLQFLCDLFCVSDSSREILPMSLGIFFSDVCVGSEEECEILPIPVGTLVNGEQGVVRVAPDIRGSQMNLVLSVVKRESFLKPRAILKWHPFLGIVIDRDLHTGDPTFIREPAPHDDSFIRNDNQLDEMGTPHPDMLHVNTFTHG